MNKNLKKPLIMDGAMGTELMRRGIELPLPLWSSMSNICLLYTSDAADE